MGRKDGLGEAPEGGKQSSSKRKRSREKSKEAAAQAQSQEQSSQLPSDDSNWQLTERLLQTLNQELGGLKEYVLTELRGEIAALRSEKVQLQSQVRELRHQQEVLLSDRQEAQQQQWAQQFAQVMTQNLRQQIQSQVFGLCPAGGQ